MNIYPTETWTTHECGLAVVELNRLIGREMCIKIATMAACVMDHHEVMAFFTDDHLPPEFEDLLAKSVEAYIRENRKRNGMN